MTTESLSLADGQLISRFRHWPEANTAAEVELTAPATGRRWRIEEILFGYNLPAPTGELAIQLDGADTIKIPVVDDGPAQYAPAGGIEGLEATAIKVTLAADTGGAKGYLNVKAREVPFAP